MDHPQVRYPPQPITLNKYTTTTMNKHRYHKEILLLCQKGYIYADKIHKALQKTYPNIWLGTIYRNLNELYQMWKLNKIPWVHNKVIYQIKEKNDENIHGHLICQNTGEVISVDVKKIKKLDLWLPTDFDIDKIEVIFYWKKRNTNDTCKGKITLN